MTGMEEIERKVVEETLKHEVTKNRAEEALEKFKENNARTRNLILAYRRADLATHRDKP